MGAQLAAGRGAGLRDRSVEVSGADSGGDLTPSSLAPSWGKAEQEGQIQGSLLELRA